MTPEVIRAGARQVQLSDFLSDEETRHLVLEAEPAGDTVIQVEIDPREGSGVIPLDWGVFLRRKGDDTNSRVVAGVNTPSLRHQRALAGRLPRNYDYDRFWVVFPLHTPDGDALFDGATTEAELVVRIHDKEGRVSWRIPDSIRTRLKKISQP